MRVVWFVGWVDRVVLRVSLVRFVGVVRLVFFVFFGVGW